MSDHEHSVERRSTVHFLSGTTALVEKCSCGAEREAVHSFVDPPDKPITFGEWHVRKPLFQSEP